MAESSDIVTGDPDVERMFDLRVRFQKHAKFLIAYLRALLIADPVFASKHQRRNIKANAGRRLAGSGNRKIESPSTAGCAFKS